MLNPTRIQLPNGATLLAKTTTTTPAVAINLGVRAGSASDPAGEPGSAWLLSRVIDRGTASRSAAEIAEALDSRGITLTITVTRHLFTLACRCLADDFEPVLTLLADIVTSPSIPEEELAIRKREVVTSIRQDDDSPAVRASEALMELLYPDGHPYGRRTKGSIPIVEGLTRERLLALHDARFAPGDLTVVIVGDVETPRIVDAAGRALGGWQRQLPPPLAIPPVAPASARQRVVIPMMNKAQADIAYGFVTIARTDPDYYAFWLMNNVFGQYSIGGRLGDSIRERQGMAYYVFSGFDASVIPGPLMVRAGVAAENVSRAVASIDEELSRMTADGPTEDELTESRQYLIGSMPRNLETNAGIASYLQMIEFFGLGLDYDLRVPDLLRAITREDVHAAARRTLDPAKAAVVVAGPFDGPLA